MAVPTYTEAEINEAIRVVETVKQNYPVGWAYLDRLHLPGDDLVAYAFTNAKNHVHKLEVVDDIVLVYAVGWLNGVSIGVALGEQRAPAT